MTAAVEVVLSLGSNVGDRRARLQSAVSALALAPGVRALSVSSVYETDPVGGPEQPDFLNAVLVVETALSPRAVLDLAHQVEADADRERIVRWGPRTLDVDLIAAGDSVVDEPDLQVPHPRAASRAFVLVPWLEVDAAASLPGAGAAAELVKGLDVTRVRRQDDLRLVLPT